MEDAAMSISPTDLSLSAAKPEAWYAMEGPAADMEKAKMSASTVDTGAPAALSSRGTIDSTTLLIPGAPSRSKYSPLKYLTTKLNGLPYVFGTFDVGSLDVGPNPVAQSTVHTGYFRKDGFVLSNEALPEGSGWQGRLALENGCYYGCPSADTEPLYYDEASGTAKRQADAVEKAGTLMTLPGEIRNMIYERASLPEACNRMKEASSSHALLENAPRNKRRPSAEWHSNQSAPRVPATYTTTPVTAMISNLQMTCREMYDEVSSFAYRHHAFYFGQPRALATFLECLSYGPVPGADKSRLLGTVVIDITVRGHPYHCCEAVKSRARPGFVVEEFAMGYAENRPEPSDPDWLLFWDYAENENNLWWQWCGEDWACAIRALTEAHKVKKLVICCEGGLEDKQRLWTPIYSAFTGFQDRERLREIVRGANVSKGCFKRIKFALGLKRKRPGDCEGYWCGGHKRLALRAE
jgi:hypothetical protein